MKKFLFVFIAAMLTVSIYSNETVSDATGDEFAPIQKEYGFGFKKNETYLKTKSDFVKALAPVPEAQKMYLSSYSFLTAGGILLGTSITLAITESVLYAFALVYSSPESFPLFYNVTLGIAFTSSALGVICLFIPAVILTIYTLIKSATVKKKAIVLYNTKVKNRNKDNTGLNVTPDFSFTSNRNLSLGFNISL
jgi:hypothetical protein